MADLNEGVSIQKAVQVRLENLSQIHNQSTFINDTQQLVRIRDRLKMMQSLGYIKNYNQRETEKKKEGERKKLSEIFPNTIMMHIQDKSGRSNFTNSHIRTLLVCVF